MARTKIYIPDEVKAKIKEHLNSKYPDAIEGYYSASEDEDSLTGDLGATFRIKNQKVNVKQDEIKGIWKWSINYIKFRGRGNNATEKRLGADGIIELKLDRGFRQEKKSVLFQSKKNWKQKDTKLIEQTALLSTWREAAFILNFTPEIYETFNIDTILKYQGKKPEGLDNKNIAEFLGDDFLECLVGDADLAYDAKKKLLKWRTMEGMIVGTKFGINHRLTINVKAPKLGDYERFDKIIDNNDIHNYRMDARVYEILSLPYNHNKTELKKAKKELALLYHPDKYSFLDDLEKSVLNRRMQEINHAYDELNNKMKK